MESQEIKDKLNALTKEAVDRGVFDVPSFFETGSNQLYFGADRLFLFFKKLDLEWKGASPIIKKSVQVPSNSEETQD